jgi:hypothetical protein
MSMFEFNMSNPVPLTGSVASDTLNLDLKSQAPSTKSQGVGCRVSGVRCQKKET